jgi:hypothetical protein
MKIKIFICILFLLSVLFTSCSGAPDTPQNDNRNDDVSSAIEQIEDKLDNIKKSQEKMNSENKVLFEKLYAEIEKLSREENTSNKNNENSNDAGRFLYEIKDGKAIITGYTGNETDIVIPAKIDGYTVDGIGESAFSKSKLTSVIISEGIRKIDWFAFYTVPSLARITLPTSIEEIGYAAFDGASSSFTVYCHNDSYALSFVMSYGFSYVIV